MNSALEEKGFSVVTLTPEDKQRFISSVNLIISMLEKGNTKGAYTLPEAAEIVQALAVLTNFVNGPLQRM